MADYLWWGNARVTPWMYYRLSQLNEHLQRLFGVGLIGNSGIRTAEEQIAIFTARYTLTPNGRRVYDTRWWNGRLWYRISDAGTVAVPSTSNHEIQGDTAAVDIADTGSDAGITAKNSTRGRWIRDNAKYFDLVAEGDSFGEGWHFKMLGIFRTPPTPAPEVPKEDDTVTSTITVNGNIYNIGEEFLKHCGTMGQVNITKNVMTVTDENHPLTLQQFVDLLDGLGIPRSVLDEKGRVLDPEQSFLTGKRVFRYDGVWSRRYEAVMEARMVRRKLGIPDPA